MRGKERILIQHCRDKSFFAGPRAWVTDPQRGLGFETPLNAIAYALQHGMEGVQVLVARENEPPEVVPLPPATNAEFRPLE